METYFLTDIVKFCKINWNI